MAYIGKIPLVGNFQICDAISVVNGQAAYTMQVASVNVIPETAQNLIVSLNGVIQKPGSSFTVSGSTITFSQNLVTGDVIDFIQILGSVLDIGTPSDGTVTTAKLGSNAVSSAKMFSGFKNGIEEADLWRLITSNSGTNNFVLTAYERPDDGGVGYLGTGMSVSSGIFTFPSTGYYLISHAIAATTVSDSVNIVCQISVDSGSNWDTISRAYVGNNNNRHNNGMTQALVDITNTSTHQIRLRCESVESTTTIHGNTSANDTFISFLRLGDT